MGSLVTFILKDAVEKPPNLRTSVTDKQCGTCGAYRNGKCRMFSDYPVKATQVCDDWVSMKYASEYD